MVESVESLDKDVESLIKVVESFFKDVESLIKVVESPVKDVESLKLVTLVKKSRIHQETDPF
jgi:hypothetical protein